jgi:hypothetical protein
VGDAALVGSDRAPYKGCPEVAWVVDWEIQASGYAASWLTIGRPGGGAFQESDDFTPSCRREIQPIDGDVIAVPIVRPARLQL